MSTTSMADTTLASPRDPLAQQKQQRRQRRRSFPLFERMNGQYWRIARRRRVLVNISLIFRDDLAIFPIQCQEAAAHLIALRRAIQYAQAFYCSLDPQSMRLVQPWGTVAKLANFDSQVTELLLYIVAMLEAITQEQISTRVQMHVLIRELSGEVLISFEDLTSQLGALVEKVQACEPRSMTQGGHT